MIVDPDFCDHWKTRMLVGCLDGDEVAPVYVLRIWSHCQNRRQWRFDGVSTEALKSLCRFPGTAEKLESALSEAGFVRRDGNVLVVCNWEEHNRTLIAAWKNGGKNRSKQPVGVPTDSPTGIPVGHRLDEIGLDDSSASSPQQKKTTPKQRKPDLLFDAIAEVTASDPAASGSYIGRVRKSLSSANPPYTPDEVRRLPEILRARHFTMPTTLGCVEKYIGWTRIQPSAEEAAKALDEVQRETLARRERDERERAASTPPPPDFGRRKP